MKSQQKPIADDKPQNTLTNRASIAATEEVAVELKEICRQNNIRIHALLKSILVTLNNHPDIKQEAINDAKQKAILTKQQKTQLKRNVEQLPTELQQTLANLTPEQIQKLLSNL